MDAIPQDLRRGSDKQVTGLSCPDCPGVLHAEVIGPQDRLEFTCRIGHTYTLQEVLEAKEESLEERVWGAVVAGEELVALLRDLVRDGRVDAETARRFITRQQSVQRLVDAFRTALQNDQPLRFPAVDKTLRDDEAPR